MPEKSRRSYVPFPEDVSFPPPVPSRPHSMSLAGQVLQEPKLLSQTGDSTSAPALPVRPPKPKHKHPTAKDFPSVSEIPKVPAKMRKGSADSSVFYLPNPEPETYSGRYYHSSDLSSPTSPNIFSPTLSGGNKPPIPEESKPALPAKTPSPRQSSLLNGLTPVAQGMEAVSPSGPPLPPRKGSIVGSTSSRMTSDQAPSQIPVIPRSKPGHHTRSREPSSSESSSREHSSGEQGSREPSSREPSSREPSSREPSSSESSSRGPSSREPSDYQNGTEDGASLDAPPPLPQRTASSRNQTRESLVGNVASADYSTKI